MTRSRLVKIITLIGLLLLTLFTRFWQIEHLPPALFSDEVDAGYQAMTFNQSQTDYFGNKFPIHFHSFSDWRTSLYIYSISVAQKLTPNQELAVRLPSAVFSLISVLLIWLLTDSIGAAFLMAISPWAIHFGRTGFEVSGMMAALLAGLYFWKLFLTDQKVKYLFLSTLLFSLSPYFYSTAKFFIIIIYILIFLVWHNYIFKIKPLWLIALSLFTLTILSPLIIDTLQGKAGYRFSYISIFTEPHHEQTVDALRYKDILNSHYGQIGVPTPFLSYIFHNKYELILEKFTSNYFSSFSTNFLLLRGDSNIRQGFGGHGLIYLIDLFVVIGGIFLSIHKKDKWGTFFLWLLILAPIPFSLTRDSLSPHATRLILMLPSLLYFSSLVLKKRPLLFIVYILFFINFWHYYSHEYSQDSARTWHTGMKQAVTAAIKINPAGPIYFSNSYEPFLPFFTFYKPYYPPQGTSLSNNLSVVHNNFIDGQQLEGRYFFGNINWKNIPLYPNKLILVVPKTEYLSLPNLFNYSLLSKIDKHYIESEEFYILEFIPHVAKN